MQTARAGDDSIPAAAPVGNGLPPHTQGRDPPMSPKNRNVVVGLTVLVGLVALAVMLLKFGGSTVKLFRPGNLVQIHLTGDRADGLAEGAQVTYLGKTVGRVLKVERDRDNVSINIDAEVDNDPPLPGNVEGAIKVASPIGGTAVLSLELVGPKPVNTLADGQRMVARYVGSELVPKEFSQLANQVKDSRIVLHLDEQVREAGLVLKGLDDYVNNPKSKADVQASIDNFRHVSEVARAASDRVDKFAGQLDQIQANANQTVVTARAEIDRVSRQIDDRMLQVSKLLDSATAVAAKVDRGPGTASLLVNDPKLYQSLVDNSRQLSLTIADLKRLVEQWEQEGVSFKLK